MCPKSPFLYSSAFLPLIFRLVEYLKVSEISAHSGFMKSLEVLCLFDGLIFEIGSHFSPG